MTMENSNAMVKINGKMSDAFVFNKGVRQGDGLSVTLFNLALHSAIEPITQRGTILHRSSQLCAYADDIVIIARNVQTLRECFKDLESRASNVGLQINDSKTKYLIISTNVSKRKPRNIDIEGKTFEGVSHFKYLGTFICNDNSLQSEIYERVQAGNRAFYANKKLFFYKLI